MTITCKNCNHNFKGKFCNQCGQTINTHEINFKSILHEVQHGILHIDKGILFTTKELFTRPGHTIREYLNGKRVKHFKPFAYIVILSTIYALLTRFSHKTTFLEEIFFGMTTGAKEKSKDNLNLFIDLFKWMANHYAYATLLIIPIISLASYLSFYKTKYNYFQHLILNSFVAGQRTVLFLLILPVVYFITDKEILIVIDDFKIVLGILLTFWTYYQFFSSTKPVKRIALTILTYFLIAVIFLTLITLIIVISKTLS
jgi:Protein of unknown function (DUF3667)